MNTIAAFFRHLLQGLQKRYYIGAGILALIGAGVVICAAFDNSTNREEIPVYSDFAGNEACVSCHKEICESGVHTAHYLTSAPASIATIKGSFAKDKNKFVYNAFMQVEMDTADGVAYQTALASNVSYETHSFDIAIGSGRKGQTYLYWNEAGLYQLPVSYYTPLNTWCNSPGYPSNIIRFDRHVTARCIECHGTYAKTEMIDSSTVFDQTQIIYGIQCERCHGAAANHVAYQKVHPADTIGMFILHIKNLSRQQKLDACALCHSGVRNGVQPAFTYQIGDTLENYLTAAYNQDSVSMLDVHGNQYGLLTSSKCFRLSQMDCSSCHNTHVTEKGETSLFSQRCMACHSNVQHSFVTAANTKLVMSNCIDCHMPALPSSKITLLISGKQKTVPDYVTTHHIAIYPEQTKAFLKSN